MGVAKLGKPRKWSKNIHPTHHSGACVLLLVAAEGLFLQREITELTDEISTVMPDLRSLLKPAALQRLEELLARSREQK